MVEQSDRAPLLDWEEVPPGQPPPSGPSRDTDDSVISEPSKCRPQGWEGSGSGWASSPGALSSGTAVRGRSPRSPSTQAGLEGDAGATDEEGDCAFTGLSIKDRRIAEWEEKDQIVAVFVVTFDTRSGGTELAH